MTISDEAPAQSECVMSLLLLIARAGEATGFCGLPLHLIERRLQDQGFSPEDVTRFVEQAMARRARPDLDVSKSMQNPALLGPGVDSATGRQYSSRLPLKSVDDGYAVRSVIPEGLQPRNNKAPKR